MKVFGYEILAFLSRKSLKDPEFRKGRLGFIRGITGLGKTPRIWFHAVSVGEVTGAVPTLLALMKKLPEAAFFLSVGTPQGLRFAREQVPEEVAVFPFPLDFPKCVARAVAVVRPNLFVAFETEFWPNFYRRLALSGVPALLLNGRVSESSERFYTFFSSLLSPVFERFDRMAMRSGEDADRVVRIGAPRGKVLVLGSSKYEGLAQKALKERAEFWRKLLRIGEGGPVLVGGSLRGSECFAVPRIFQKLRELSPGLIGIFAPRHLHNIPKMVRLLCDMKIAYDLLSDIESGNRQRTAPVILVDRIGVLFEIYSLGDLIFCGGTLEPVGGHNILEPSAWGKAVFYGPHLKKVSHEHRILHSFGGSFLVADEEDLLAQWKRWVVRLDALDEHGLRAAEALGTFSGVVDRQVELILETLSKGCASGGPT